MKTINWKDGIEARGRRKGLIIIPPSGAPYWFKGGSDQSVRVISSIFKKDGKWSHTQFALELAEGVRSLSVIQGWDTGKWREGFATALGLSAMATWAEIAQSLDVPESTLVGPKPEKGPGNFIVIPDGPTSQSSEVD